MTYDEQTGPSKAAYLQHEIQVTAASKAQKPESARLAIGESG